MARRLFVEEYRTSNKEHIKNYLKKVWLLNALKKKLVKSRVGFICKEEPENFLEKWSQERNYFL